MREAERSRQKVAAYARVSTDSADQESSLAAQTDYYQKMISSHPGWQFAGIFVDDGISGLSTERRDGFNEMIETALSGGIDLVLTKSISRFARNTVDTITVIRLLREKDIGVFFEKENLFTLDSKSEFLLAVMSSLAQEESRSISENVRWGIRKKFADGKGSVAYSTFLGYDKGPQKHTMVVNEEQAKTVKRIYFLYLQGYGIAPIRDILDREGAKTPAGGRAWCPSTIRSILTNERYKGDAMLQKTWTADFLNKKVMKNNGEVPRFYVKEDHEAIIPPDLFDYVQERIEERHAGADDGHHYSGTSVLHGMLICGKCGAYFGPRPWHSNDKFRVIMWQCLDRWKKPDPCKTCNIADKALHYAIHDMARDSFFGKRLDKVLRSILKSVMPDEPYVKARDYLYSLKDRNAGKLLCDEDDLGLIIRRIVILPDGTMRFEMIDGAKITRKVPRYDRAKDRIWYEE